MTTQVHNEKLSPWPWQVSQQHVSFDPVGMDKKLKIYHKRVMWLTTRNKA